MGEDALNQSAASTSQWNASDYARVGGFVAERFFVMARRPVVHEDVEVFVLAIQFGLDDVARISCIDVMKLRIDEREDGTVEKGFDEDLAVAQRPGEVGRRPPSLVERRSQRLPRSYLTAGAHVIRRYISAFRAEHDLGALRVE